MIDTIALTYIGMIQGGIIGALFPITIPIGLTAYSLYKSNIPNKTIIF